ncbi:MAG: hypothetical protein QOI91_452 [Solirubrobacteraceae bacterium]|jgi:hypothetical protein|nr:hypothetical protein [Solirubrobacteraceae bacterium]
MTRSRLASTFACALGAAACTAPLALAARTSSPAPDARVRLVSCRGGLDPLGRSLTVDSEMHSLHAGDHMEMRFELLQRVSGSARFRRVPGPGLGTWNPATPGVQRYRFRKPIQNLPAPAAYYVKVRFRWKDDAGHVVAAVTRSSAVCVQADTRPDLRIASVGEPRRVGPGRFAYPVVLVNSGRGTSRDFDAVVTVGDTPEPARTVAGLAPGARRSVDLTGSRCPAGTPASVQLDPDNRVDESDERNNVRSFTCP